MAPVTPAAPRAAAPAASSEVSAPSSPGAPAPANASVDEASGNSQVSSDVRAERAFELLAEGLHYADERAWAKARDKLLDAWSYAEFPNIAFHLAVVYDALGEPQRAREQLARYQSLAQPTNVNYAAASTLSAKLRGASAASTPPPRPSPVPDTSRSEAPVAPLVLAGSGAAMLLAAVTTGLLANAAEGELERNCPRDSCPSYLESVADRGRTMKLVTNVLLIAGGTALGAGAAWWFGAACSSATEGCSAALTGRF